MFVYHKMVVAICRSRGIQVSDALKAAGVSSNAYYSLARKESVLPRSIRSLASALGVPVSALLFDEDVVAERHAGLMSEVNQLAEELGIEDRDIKLSWPLPTLVI